MTSIYWFLRLKQWYFKNIFTAAILYEKLNIFPDICSFGGISDSEVYQPTWEDDGWWLAIFYVFLLAQNIQCPQKSSSSQINIHNKTQSNLPAAFPFTSNQKMILKNMRQDFVVSPLLICEYLKSVLCLRWHRQDLFWVHKSISWKKAGHSLSWISSRLIYELCTLTALRAVFQISRGQRNDN